MLKESSKHLSKSIADEVSSCKSRNSLFIGYMKFVADEPLYSLLSYF